MQLIGYRRASVGMTFVILAFSALVTTLSHGAEPAVTAGVNAATARVSPDWLRDAVVYEIFPRDFSASGDFRGVTAKLDDLKQLGVDVLWLMPIHPVGKLKAKGTLGSPYAVRDYDAINADFGTAADLEELVAGAHKRGMKVFIDIVANHTSWDSVLLEKHPDWYHHDAAGHIIPPNPDWVDVAHLDYSSAALREYMTQMLVRWLHDFDLDGFRCDYASGVPRDFWESVRPALERTKPGVVMLAEADDPSLLLKAFDFDYAWDFYHTVGDAIAGRAPASAVRTAWLRAEAGYPRGALRLRFSDNHDQMRATGQFGLPAALVASALMFTLDGIPLLYNGMEIGDTTESTAPALFERAPIAWEVAERRPQVLPYYRALLALRHEHPALTRGTVRWLSNDAETRVLTFERKDTSETLVIAINLSSVAYVGRISKPAGEYRELTPGRPMSVVKMSAVPLAPWEFRVFRRARS